MTRRRVLTAGEIEVWRAVADSVTQRMPGAFVPGWPEPVRLDVPRPEAARRGALAPVPPKARPAGPTAPSWSPPPQKPVVGLGDVERGLRKRVAKGRHAIDAKLDLHGFRQSEAHVRLSAFLARSQASGYRIVLVVTGKGRSDEGGVLRRLVPLWLAEPRLAPMIVGVGEAGPGHGGEGALYVHLRGRHRMERP